MKRDGTHSTVLSTVRLRDGININMLTAAMLTYKEHSFKIFEHILDCALATDDDELLRNILTVRIRKHRELLGPTPLSLCVGYEDDFPQYFSPILDAIRGKPYVIAHVLNAKSAGVPVLSTAIGVGATEKAEALLDLIKDNPKLVQFVLKSTVNVRYGSFLGYTPLMVAIAKENKRMIGNVSKIIVENDINPDAILFVNRMEKTGKTEAKNLLMKLRRRYYRQNLTQEKMNARRLMYGEPFALMRQVNGEGKKEFTTPQMKMLKIFKFK